MPPNRKAFPFILLVLVAIILKAPALMMLVVVASVIVAAASIVSIPNRAKRQSAIGPPKVVNIDGVGEVEWITDPSQLDHKQLLGLRGLRELELEVLRSSPADWIEQGEKVAVSEEEVANRPESTPQSDYQRARARKQGEEKRARERYRHGHPSAVDPTCHTCLFEQLYSSRAMILPNKSYEEVHELTVAEKEAPVAYYTADGNRYAAGGIVGTPVPMYPASVPLVTPREPPHKEERLEDLLAKLL
jgi:hypothetical protein